MTGISSGTQMTKVNSSLLRIMYVGYNQYSNILYDRLYVYDLWVNSPTGKSQLLNYFLGILGHVPSRS